MMKKLILFLIILSVAACEGKSKLDEPQKPKTNVARDNAMVSYPDAKCDEIGFEEPELHSVRCTLKNGVRIYCSAGVAGHSCNPIYAPEEVLRAAQAQQDAAAKAQQEAAAKAAADVKKSK